MKFELLVPLIFVSECLAVLIFWKMSIHFGGKLSIGSVLRGVLERMVLLLGFWLQMPQVLILFGALKLGTRFEGQTKNKVSQDYFLTGNFTSALIALLVFCAYKYL